MNFLLDTHIWIWSLLDPDRLTRKVRKVLASGDNELWLSPISIWETLILIDKGRVILTEPADQWIHEALDLAPIREAPLTHDIARLSRLIDVKHEDPADRFIAATAKYLNLTLITADDRLLHSSEFATLPNI